MKYCECCAEAHIVKEATVRMTWDLGEKWICEDCAFEIMGKMLEASKSEVQEAKDHERAARYP